MKHGVATLPPSFVAQSLRGKAQRERERADRLMREARDLEATAVYLDGLATNIDRLSEALRTTSDG